MLLFSVHYVVLRGFYALEDTRTPFFIQCVIAAVNIVLAITLTMTRRAAERRTGAGPGLRRVVPRRRAHLPDVLSHRLGGLQKVDAARVRRPGPAAQPSLPALLAAVTLGLLEAAGLRRRRARPTRWCCSPSAGSSGSLVYILVARLLRIDEIRQVVAVVTRRGRSGARPAA